MFKARHRQLDRHVISLDPRLSREQLYQWTNADLLACPECGTDVGFRSGEVRRPHFFHRALVDCKYHHGEPEVVAARALLYGFLFRKAEGLGGEVDTDKRLPDMPDRELIDVWLQLPGKAPVAYRIFQRGPQPARLRKVEELIEAEGAIARYMLTVSRLELNNRPDELLLMEDQTFIPAYDRRLLFARSWDRYYQHRLEPIQRDSILYIDPQEELLHLFRDLRHPLDCNPNVFEYQERLESPMAEVRMLSNGEFVLAQEVPLKEQWEAWAAQEMKRRDEEAALRARQAEESRKEQTRLEHLPVPKSESVPDPFMAYLQRQRLVSEALTASSGRSYYPGSAVGNPFACEERIWQEIIRTEYANLYSQPGAQVSLVDIAAFVAATCGLHESCFNFRDVAVIQALREFFEDEAKTSNLRVSKAAVRSTRAQ